MSDAEKAQDPQKAEVVRIIAVVLQRMSDSRKLFEEILQQHIPLSVGTMKTVAQMSEDSANSILTSCETIRKLLANANIYVPKVEAEITKIMLSCSSQDLTNQKLAKIVRLMDDIHDRMTELKLVLDGKGSEIAASHAEGVDKSTGKRSIPSQKQTPPAKEPDKTFSQNDIDMLFDE